MSNLGFRDISFSLDDVPFLWNPSNPAFSVLMNQITLFVVGFEKYMCRVMRDAEAVITDPEVLEEARAFRLQEAIHAKKHMQHARALIKQYPPLQTTFDQVMRDYDELYERESLAYHLAYAGGLEAMFTPFFKMILDHRDVLFADGDVNVASLFLWHFCEEIEHRSSAFMVYNHVVGSHWYRLRNIPSFQRHTRGLFDMIKEDFAKIVDDVPAETYRANPFSKIPLLAQLRSAVGVFLSQAPWHDSVNQPLPEYFDEWMEAWQTGKDVSKIYGKAGTA